MSLHVILCTQNIDPYSGLAFNPEDPAMDLGIVFLTLAKKTYPNLHIEKFDQIIDYMAGKIEQLMEGSTDSTAPIGVVNAPYQYGAG